MRWVAGALAALLAVTANANASLRAPLFPDQGAAHAACHADLTVIRKLAAANPHREMKVRDACRFSDPGGSELTYECSLSERGVALYWCGIKGSGHNSTSYRFPRGKTCSSRPAGSGGFYLAGKQSACSDGCRYDEGQIVGSMELAGKRYYQSSGAKPTGDVCTYDASKDATEVTEDQCHRTGTLTQCVTKDGKHCAVASTGKKFCWEPTETGTKVSGNEAATKAPQGSEISAPPKPPTDGGDWQSSGSGSMSGGSGGSSNGYDITGWNSNGDGNGSGEGGGGEGGGDGDGKGDGEGNGDNPGSGVGDLYKGTDKTVAGLMGKFYAQASNAPVMKGITNFMGINGGGGTCPVFTLPASDYWKAMTFDAHCSDKWLELLKAMGWIVLAIAAYVAVRIAVT